ncbi:hypothetical protein M989_01640 [Kluyvera georgiana ATCC 51603]|uniref:Uncharacterized protein n=1 Tax=Kluyvera georgiana ATCC 51603 TaxID=1354264 RepID=A0A1B7K2H2_9ENTR|nr:hypothetical protein M989_01640 [Kluyvera georgiana ATCC 51603]
MQHLFTIIFWQMPRSTRYDGPFRFATVWCEAVVYHNVHK